MFECSEAQRILLTHLRRVVKEEAAPAAETDKSGEFNWEMCKW